MYSGVAPSAAIPSGNLSRGCLSAGAGLSAEFSAAPVRRGQLLRAAGSHAPRRRAPPPAPGGTPASACALDLVHGSSGAEQERVGKRKRRERERDAWEEGIARETR